MPIKTEYPQRPGFQQCTGQSIQPNGLDSAHCKTQYGKFQKQVAMPALAQTGSAQVADRQTPRICKLNDNYTTTDTYNIQIIYIRIPIK